MNFLGRAGSGRRVTAPRFLSQRRQHRNQIRRSRRIGGVGSVLAVILALLVAACAGQGSPSPTQQGSQTDDESGASNGAAEGADPQSDAEAGSEPALAWGPTEAELAEATERAAQMSDEDLAGQVIIARYSGTDPAQAAAVVRAHHLAGVILFADNIASLDQVRATAAAVQEAHSDLGRDWPAAVSVDNEGGLVQRMSAASGPWTSFPQFAAAGAAADPVVVTEAAAAMARELRASGVTMNFAPVADVSIGPQDPTINTRAAGSEPEVVSAAVAAAVDGFDDGGVLASLKHFPGHGSLTVDSHESLPVQRAAAEDLAERDLVPFEAGIRAGAPMVMMGHIAVEEWDPGVPATLSPAAYEVLREDLGFTGVAITDGLDMGALTATRSSGQIALEALNAGADLLLTPADVAGAHEAIVAALADGSLDRERVVQAAGRVIAMQRWQAQQTERQAPDDDEVGAGAPASQALSASAISLVAGECEGPWLGQSVFVQGGAESDVAAFRRAAANAGLEVTASAGQADTSVALIGTGGGPAMGADVAIALDHPWDLAGADAPTLVAAHGRTEHTMAALVEALTDTQAPPGRLAFDVEGLPGTACP